jgi:hypothetical protein
MAAQAALVQRFFNGERLRQTQCTDTRRCPKAADDPFVRCLRTCTHISCGVYRSTPPRTATSQMLQIRVPAGVHDLMPAEGPPGMPRGRYIYIYIYNIYIYIYIYTHTHIYISVYMMPAEACQKARPACAGGVHAPLAHSTRTLQRGRVGGRRLLRLLRMEQVPQTRKTVDIGQTRGGRLRG